MISLMIGETISHYRILKKVGEGGMGEVYVAEDVLLGRRVAVKTLNSKSGTSGQHFRARFLREARAISALSHQNIANIYDYGETTEGQPYIVMELVEGQTLVELMRTESLTIPRAIEIVKQVAQALSEAHLHGIVHRDIKPSNIAINERGVVKVLDFGLAKHVVTSGTPEAAPVHTQTREGVVVGTPMYLSPEQALALDIDARSDLFSLGSVLYECITGRPAFPGDSEVDICAKVIRDDPPPPSTLNPSVGAVLDQVTLKVLAKKPNDRYQTAEELLTHLQSPDLLQESNEEANVLPLSQPTKSILHTPRTRGASSVSSTLSGAQVPIGYVVLALLVISVAAFIVWRMTRPKSYQPAAEAQHWYDEGTLAIQSGTYFKATRMMEKALEQDDNFALAHARLAESWAELGYVDKAASEISKANLLVSNSSLSSVDALYLEAINRTVSHEFKRAGESYRQIIRKVSSADVAYAYVDLGRAYEKDEDLANAIGSYQQAISKDPQYAAAFLRAGALQGRLQNFADAEQTLNKAYDLFQIQSNPEGMAEVLIQRGVVLSSKDPARAGEPLQQALQIVRTFTNPSQETKTLLQLSNVSRLTGDNDAAEHYATQAKDVAAKNGLSDLYTQSILEIGYVHFYRSEILVAQKNFQEALTRAQTDQFRVTEARAQLALGGLHIQQDDADAGLPLLEQALPFFEQNIYRKEIMIAQTYLGQAYGLKGQLTDARTAFENALNQAKVLNNQSQIGVEHKNLGTLLAGQQKYNDALDHINQAYSVYNALTKKLDAAYALVSKAEMEWRLGDYDAAASDLNLASSYAEQPNTKFKQLWGRIYVASAPMKLSRRDFAGAIVDANKGIKADTSGTQHPAIEAQSTLGLAQFLYGKKQEGKRTAEKTVDPARKTGDPRLLGAALLALAEILVESHDGQDALTAANEAREILERTEQLDSEWRARLMAGRAYQLLGDYQSARAEFLKATNIFTGLEQRFGNENYRRYQERPDVMVYRKQLMTASAR
jgi:eukaryotic-like serine/threonine-protein kinase